MSKQLASAGTSAIVVTAPGVTTDLDGRSILSASSCFDGHGVIQYSGGQALEIEAPAARLGDIRSPGGYLVDNSAF